MRMIRVSDLGAAVRDYLDGFNAVEPEDNWEPLEETTRELTAPGRTVPLNPGLNPVPFRKVGLDRPIPQAIKGGVSLLS